MDCIRTENLTHHFRRQPPVLSGLELRVPTGSIYGFLGPNGAGKTTTLRLILGLLRIQQGRIEIFNQSLAKNRIAILKNILPYMLI